MFQNNGVVWVKGGMGGISTWEYRKVGFKHWRHCPAGSNYGPFLVVLPNSKRHWSWAPIVDMPLDDYKKALTDVNVLFT